MIAHGTDARDTRHDPDAGETIRSLRKEERRLRRGLPRASRRVLTRIDRRLGLLGAPETLRAMTLRDTAQMLADAQERGQGPREALGDWRELCASVMADAPRQAPRERVVSALSHWTLLVGCVELVHVGLHVAATLPRVLEGLAWGIGPLVYLDLSTVILGVCLALALIPLSVGRELGRLANPTGVIAWTAGSVLALGALWVMTRPLLWQGHSLNGYQPWKVACLLVLPFAAHLALRTAGRAMAMRAQGAAVRQPHSPTT